MEFAWNLNTGRGNSLIKFSSSLTNESRIYCILDDEAGRHEEEQGNWSEDRFASWPSVTRLSKE